MRLMNDTVKALRGLYSDRSTAPGILLGMAILLLCAWLYSLTSYSISIDQEFAAYRTDQSAWAAQGRWLSYLLTVGLLPQPVVPMLPILILILSLFGSYLLLLAAHRLTLNWRTLLLFPVFSAFPFWYLISEFYANLLSVAVGQILVSLAVLVFVRVQALAPPVSRTERLGGWLVCAVLVCLATGAYQSFLLAFATLGAGVLLWDAARGEPPCPPLLPRLLALGAVCVFAVLGFWLIDQWVKWLLDVQGDDYIQQMNRLDLILRQPGQVLRSTLAEAVQIYGGTRAEYGVPLWATGVLMGLGGLALPGPLWHRPQARFSLLAGALGCLALPFALHVLAGGGGTIPHRSMVVIPYVVWLFAALAVHAGSRLVRTLAVASLVLVSAQILNAHASYNALRTLTLDHDKALASQIYTRVVKLIPDFDRNQSFLVDFYGAKPYVAPFPKVATSTIGWSFFAWDGGNPDRVLALMRLLGLEGLDPVSAQTRHNLIPVYQSMPIWPAEGSVQRRDGVVLVKLGPDPGVFHR